MTKAADEEHAFLYVMRVLMVSFLKGTAPIMAVEMARAPFQGMCGPHFRSWKKLAVTKEWKLHARSRAAAAGS